MKTSFFSLPGLCAILTSLAAASAAAQNSTWTGGGNSSLWSDPGNWAGGAIPVPAPWTELVFTGSAGAAENDIAGPFTLSKMEFQSLTGDFSLGGESLLFVYNGSPVIRHTSSHTVTINNTITVSDGGNADLDITGGSDAASILRFGGQVTNDDFIGITRGAATYTAFDGGIANNGGFSITSGSVGFWGDFTNNGALVVNSSLRFNSGTTANFQQGSSFLGTSSSTIEFTGGAVNFNGAAPYTFRSPGTVLINGSTLAGSADFTLDLAGGFLDWRAGTIGGNGSALIKLDAGQLEGPATKAILRALTIQGGTLSWNGGDIDLGASGSLTLEGATLNATGLAGNITASAPGTRLDLVSGAISKISGASSAVEIQPEITADASSMIASAAGGIKFVAGGVFHSSALSAAEGAWLEFAGGTTNLDGTASVTAGTGGLRITGGTFNINGNAVAINSDVELESGATLGGSAPDNTINASSGNFHWNGGSITGPSGSTTTLAGSVQLAGSAQKTLDTRNLVLQSGGSWSGGNFALHDANLYIGGDFDIQSNQTLAFTGTSGAVFVNAGATLSKTSNYSGVTIIEAPVEIGGTLAAVSGKMRLLGGGVIAGNGHINTFSDGSVEFAGGTFDINNTAGFGSLDGEPYGGQYTISSGATVNINVSGTTVNRRSGLTLAEGGTLGGSATLATIEGYIWGGSAFNWTGGTIKGPDISSIFAVVPSAMITGNATKTIDNRRVELGGTWEDGDIVLHDGELFIKNASSLLVRANATISSTGANGGVIVSGGGLLVKNLSPTTTTISAPVLAAGEIRATAGKILLAGGGTFTGVISTLSPGVIEFGGGTFELNNAGFGAQSGHTDGGGYLISSGATVRVNSNGITINTDSNLTLSEGGTLGGNATGYTIAGTSFAWTGGTISGAPNRSVTISAPTTISGTATKTIDTRNVTLGNAIWSGGDISVKDADLTLASSVFLVQSDKTIRRDGTSGALVINPGSNFLKNTANGTTIVEVPVINGSNVTAVSGTIRFTGGGNLTGNGGFNTYLGGAIEFAGGTFELNNTFGFGSPGDPYGGRFSISSGATVNVNTAASMINQGSDLTLSEGGVLGGASTNFTIAGTSFAWTGGSILGSAGSNVFIGAPTTISGTAAKTVEGRSVNLLSDTIWEGGDIDLKDADLILLNKPLVINSDNAINSTGTTGSLVLNSLTQLIKNTTGGTTSVNVFLQNHSVIDAQTGKIVFAQGGSSNGFFNTRSGSTIEFAGGTFEMNNSQNFGSQEHTGAGQYIISDGATVNINTDEANINQYANLSLSGTLGGTSANFTVSGESFDWKAGSITGPTGSLVIAPDITISGAATKTLDTRGARLAGRWTGGNLTVNNSELKIVGAGLSVTADATLGGSGNVVNDATFAKNSTGTTTVAVAFTNNGDIQINAGTLVVDSAITGQGTLLVGAAGKLAGSGSISGPTTVLGTVAPGHSPGSLIFGDDLNFESGSVYSFELGAFEDDSSGGLPGTDWDCLVLAGASDLTFASGSLLTLSFTGIANPNTPGTFWDGVTDKSWLIADLDSGTLDWNSLAITNANWATGSFHLANSGNDLYLQFTAVPEPSTWLLALIAIVGFWLFRRQVIASKRPPR